MGVSNWPTLRSRPSSFTRGPHRASIGNVCPLCPGYGKMGHSVLDHRAMTIEELIARVRQYDPSLDDGFLRRVYEVAEGAHEGQRRASGESYIEHPLSVAKILAEMEMDRETIAAA